MHVEVGSCSLVHILGMYTMDLIFLFWTEYKKWTSLAMHRNSDAVLTSEVITRQKIKELSRRILCLEINEVMYWVYIYSPLWDIWCIPDSVSYLTQFWTAGDMPPPHHGQLQKHIGEEIYLHGCNEDTIWLVKRAILWWVLATCT